MRHVSTLPRSRRRAARTAPRNVASCTATGFSLHAQRSGWFQGVLTLVLDNLGRARAHITTIRATVGLSSLRYTISLMCESGCIIRTPLTKSNVVISHRIFLCAASSAAVNTDATHTSTRTPRPALSLSVHAQSISARGRCALIVPVHVPDAIKITPRRDRGQARRAPRQTYVQRIELHPLRIPSGAGICPVCARRAPDVFVSQCAARIFPRSLHGAHTGRNQSHSCAAITRSSARAHD
jgi:hypothetical protein